MKNLLSVVCVLCLISCGKQQGEHTMIINGQVKNLKKGTIFLQKMKDTLLVTVDSIHLNGESSFTLSDEVESPEMYYLSLEKSPQKNVSFFGEKGVFTIDTKLDKFFYAASIIGLENQQLLEQYEEMNSQFSNSNLQLIKDEFDASKQADSILLDSIRTQLNSLQRRKYLFAANFAVRHGDKAVAPYIALRDLYDANVKLLDTINNSMSPEIKASKYGKELGSYIEEIKKKDSKQ